MQTYHIADYAAGIRDRVLGWRIVLLDDFSNIWNCRSISSTSQQHGSIRKSIFNYKFEMDNLLSMAYYCRTASG
jgi:hypothetical protein